MSFQTGLALVALTLSIYSVWLSNRTEKELREFEVRIKPYMLTPEMLEAAAVYMAAKSKGGEVLSPFMDVVSAAKTKADRAYLAALGITHWQIGGRNVWRG